MQNNPYLNPSQNYPPLLGPPQQNRHNNYPDPNVPINGFAPPPPQPPRNPYAHHVPGQFHPQPLYTGPMPGFLPSLVIPCGFCNRQTASYTKRVPGGVTWMWCLGLYLCTGVCCCIPFCATSCHDTEYLCVACQQVKARSEAECC